jgi:regulator of sigma E protease
MLDTLGGLASYIVPFLLVLTTVVTIHELGHYWAARSFGVAIDQFSVGFGRAIAKWTDKRGVEWRIGWLPLGGYVSFSGDDNASSLPDPETLRRFRAHVRATEGEGAELRYFHFKPIWQKAIIVAAGPIANFLLSVAIFSVLLATLGEVRSPPRVSAVAAGSPAAAAGFQPGDVIVSALGRRIENFTDVERLVIVRAGEPIPFVVERDGRRVELVGTPERRLERDPISGSEQPVGRLGLAGPSRNEVTRHRVPPLEAIPAGVRETWQVLDTSLTYLGRIVTGRESGDQLSGPLGIAKASGDIAAAGADSGRTFQEKLLGSILGMVGLTAILSVGIGFLNLLPIPILDGGHLAFYGYEAVARRPVSARVQNASYRVGLALLLCLMLFVTWNDLQRLRVFQVIGGLFS